MVFVKFKTSIPVPTVYGYCSTRENVIGQPFVIMSFVSCPNRLNLIQLNDNIIDGRFRNVWTGMGNPGS